MRSLRIEGEKRRSCSESVRSRYFSPGQNVRKGNCWYIYQTGALSERSYEEGQWIRWNGNSWENPWIQHSRRGTAQYFEEVRQGRAGIKNCRDSIRASGIIRGLAALCTLPSIFTHTFRGKWKMATFGIHSELLIRQRLWLEFFPSLPPSSR